MDKIVHELFEFFKNEYGYEISDAESLFVGQCDFLEFLIRVGRKLECELVKQMGTGYAGPKIGREGVELEFKDYRTRTLYGLFGDVQIRRVYYVGPEGQTCYPLD